MTNRDQQIKDLLALIPKAAMSINHNPHVYVRHEYSSLRHVWNGLLELIQEATNFTGSWCKDSRDFKSHASFAARLLDETYDTELQQAWYRMRCVDRATLREYGQVYFAEHPELDAVEVHTTPPRATSRLIAAAPDLLEACELIAGFYTMTTQEFIERFGHGVSTRDVGDKARAAIAKATGKQGN